MGEEQLKKVSSYVTCTMLQTEDFNNIISFCRYYKRTFFQWEQMFPILKHCLKTFIQEDSALLNSSLTMVCSQSVTSVVVDVYKLRHNVHTSFEVYNY